MNTRILKYLLDILSVTEELEQLKLKVGFDFKTFTNDFTAVRTPERDLEIIGEALNQMNKLDSSLEITDAKRIVGLRNLIIHSYDSVNHEIVWGILIKNIPTLKSEILHFKESGY